MEWFRFILTAALLALAIFSFACAVRGVYRFGFVMNRMHASGIGDTMGLLCVLLALMISAGSGMEVLKLILLAAFLWCTSPVSSHFLGQVEYYNNDHLDRHIKHVEVRQSKPIAGNLKKDHTGGGTQA